MSDGRPPVAPRARAQQALRLLLLALSVAFLARQVRWQDRVEVPGRAEVGLALEGAASGTALVLDDGRRVPLSPAEAGQAQVHPGLRSTLERLSVPTALLLGLIYLGAQVSIALRWHSILRLLGWTGPFPDTLGLGLRGFAVGLVLPGAVGSDVYRAAALRGSGFDLGRVVFSLLVDRVLGLWVLVALGGVVGLALGRSGPSEMNLFLAAVAGLMPLGAAALAGGFQLLPESIRARLPVEAIRALVAGARANPGRALTALVASSCNTAVHVGVYLGLLHGLGGAPVSLGAAMAAVTLGFIVNALPLTPNGLGVGDAAFVTLLGLAGVPAVQVVATTLTFRLLVYLVALALTPLLLIGRSPAASTSPPA